MAEDFKALVAAQKETSKLIQEQIRQSMTAEERAATDTANESRSESARRGWETRQENIALAEQQATINQNQALYHAQEDGEDTANTGEEQSGYLSDLINFFKKDSDKDGAAAAEDSAKGDSKDSEMMGYLKQTAGFLGGIASQGMQKVKSGLGGLSKFLIGGLAVAALAFLDHPKFKEMIVLLKKTIIPLLATFYDEVLVPIGEALSKLFGDIMLALKGEKSLMSVLMDNKLAILGIVTALAPNLVFGALKLAVMSIGKALLWASAKSGLTALIIKGLTALKLGFIAMKASVASFLPPLLPIIAIVALMVSLFAALSKAFDDFRFELEATGSIWEATKTAIMSFIANFFGFIPNLIKSTLSWIIGKIGSIFGLEAFTDVSKAMDEFDFVEGITSLLTMVGDTISGIWDGLLDAIEGILRSPKLKFLGGGFAADALFGTPEEQSAKKKVKEEEQKQFELNRKALKEKQKLEKEVEEAKKVEKLKVEQNAMQTKPVTAPALAPVGAYAAAASNIVNAPTSVVNANSSSNTTTSTPVRQPNMVIGMLAAST